MLKSHRLYCETGIAIGPILFIIALLALLAAAIAAGSGSFTGSTTNENAKLMASTFLQQTSNLDDAVNLVRGTGYSDTQISFLVTDNLFVDPVWGQDWGQDASIGYSMNPDNPPSISDVCTTHSCKVYDPAGGGMTPPIAPLDAMDISALLAMCPPPGTASACRAPITTLVQRQIEGGVNAPIRLAQLYWGLTKSVCMAINTLVGVQNPSEDAPHVMSGYNDPAPYNSNFFFWVVTFDNTLTFTASKDFCYQEQGSVYAYAPYYSYVHIY